MSSPVRVVVVLIRVEIQIRRFERKVRELFEWRRRSSRWDPCRSARLHRPAGYFFAPGSRSAAMHSRTRYPRAAPIMAYAIPVFPEVASRITFPGVSFPVRSPSRIMFSAGRSLTEPPGLNHSAFASRVDSFRQISRDFAKTKERGVSDARQYVGRKFGIWNFQAMSHGFYIYP